MIDKTDFIRQRRNLIVISLILLGVEAFGLEIKRINALGNEILIQNPGMVNVALWLAWAYWFIRYYQYFHDLQDRGFKTAYAAKMSELMIKAAFRQGVQHDKIHADRPTLEGKELLLSSKTKVQISTKKLWVIDLVVDYEDTVSIKHSF